MVCDTGLKLYTYVEGKIQPLVDSTFFLYDQATQKITSYI